MNILIAASINEYSSIEDKELTSALTTELKKLGHKIDWFFLPFKPDPITVLDQILYYQMLDMSAAELLITIGYPAFALQHPNKIIYLFETMPSLHEYWDTEYGILGNYQYSQILINLNEIEFKFLTSAKKVFYNSKLLFDDLAKRYDLTGVLGGVLYLPKFENEIKNSANNRFITESCLLQNSRYIELLENIKNIDNLNLDIYVPEAHKMNYDSLKRLIVSFKLGERVSINVKVIFYTPVHLNQASKIGHPKVNYIGYAIIASVHKS